MRLVISACDSVMQALFVPVARELRGRGWDVDFFTAFRRERDWLRRSGEAPLPATLRPSSTPLPETLHSHVQLRSMVGEIVPGPRLDAFAASLLQAAAEAMADADMAVVWNGGDLHPAVVAHCARARDLPLLFCEAGLLPRTFQMDPEGVNAASRAARTVAAGWRDFEPLRLPETGAGGVAAPPPPRPWRWLVTAAEIVEAAIDEPRARFSLRARLRDIARGGRRRTPLPGDAAALPERFVFVPLQVHDDTQLLYHGGWVDSMETLLRNVLAASERLGLPVVVREHPVDTGRIDYRELEARVPGALWTRTRDLADSLRRASVVVTTNSTVGLEALLAGRPVVVCGQAIYGVPDVVPVASTPEDLAPTLERALLESPDAGDVRRLLGAIHATLHVDAHWRDPDAASVVRVADRIEREAREHRSAS